MRKDESSRSPRTQLPLYGPKGSVISDDPPCRIGARDERYPWWCKRVQIVQFGVSGYVTRRFGVARSSLVLLAAASLRVRE